MFFNRALSGPGLGDISSRAGGFLQHRRGDSVLLPARHPVPRTMTQTRTLLSQDDTEDVTTWESLGSNPNVQEAFWVMRFTGSKVTSLSRAGFSWVNLVL